MRLKMERKEEEAQETREELEASTELSAETKAALCILIKELDEILRSPKLTDSQKVVSIEALLYTWITANKLPIWEARREGDFVTMKAPMKRLVDLKTYIPEKRVWVSTVAYDKEIGFNRCAETMVFKGDKDGITDWSELYYEDHGHTTDEKELRKRHEEIVRKIREGEIELQS
mgnify:CR=1 FL=1